MLMAANKTAARSLVQLFFQVCAGSPVHSIDGDHRRSLDRLIVNSVIRLSVYSSGLFGCSVFRLCDRMRFGFVRLFPLASFPVFLAFHDYKHKYKPVINY